MQTRPNMWKMSLGVVALCGAWMWETSGEGGGGVCACPVCSDENPSPLMDF